MKCIGFEEVTWILLNFLCSIFVYNISDLSLLTMDMDDGYRSMEFPESEWNWIVILHWILNWIGYIEHWIDQDFSKIKGLPVYEEALGADYVTRRFPLRHLLTAIS